MAKNRWLKIKAEKYRVIWNELCEIKGKTRLHKEIVQGNIFS